MVHFVFNTLSLSISNNLATLEKKETKKRKKSKGTTLIYINLG